MIYVCIPTLISRDHEFGKAQKVWRDRSAIDAVLTYELIKNPIMNKEW